MNKKPDKLKKYKRFCTRTDRNFFQKMFIIKKDAKLVLNGKTRTSFTFMKTSREDFITGVSHRMIWTVLKTESRHVALLTEKFFFMSNPERFLSSLKKTIVLYLVKKFETFMMIFYILILYWNFELIFEFMALKRAPICGQNVCLFFFLSIFKSNNNLNQRK